MIGKLITLAEAKKHLLIDHNAFDSDVDTKRIAASVAIMSYIKADFDDTGYSAWIDENGEPTDAVDAEVKAACLLALGAMFENRDGDVWRSPQVISQSVQDLLIRHRDPALA